MGKKRKQDLSQKEIWDDSALVDSWNEAYDEYKLYHSIHAKGENVKEVIAAYEAAEAAEEAKGQAGGGGVNGSAGSGKMADATAAEPSEDGEIEDSSRMETEQPVFVGPHLPADAVNGTAQAVLPETPGQEADVRGIPQAVLPFSTQDPAIKNLLMSWYWSGFYTGLYEGQKQASSAAQGGKGMGERR